MPIRRPHRKSRHGCKACKQRRVKCDEERPVCTSCRIREEECEYVAEASIIWADETVRRPKRRKSSLKDNETTTPDTSDASDAPFNILDSPPRQQPSTQDASLDIAQMRLLVNWQRETCQFFARGTETMAVWQVHTVDEALKTPPLMHGILSVSALHLALTEPAEQASWMALATAHKGEALHFLREGLGNVTPDNAQPLTALAALAVAYAFGSALADLDAERPSLDALNNVFVLCRGVEQITDAAYYFMRQSNFAPLFYPRDTSSAIPEYVHESLNHLNRLNTELHSEAHDAATYTQVIAELVRLAGYAFTQPNSMTVAAGWPIGVSPKYLEYLQAKEPFALVVLAHYCAFLHMPLGNCFLREWGQTVLQDIFEVLDEYWKPYISWPCAEVFGEIF
ncbi:hypothetical protein BDV18DRAFT_129683 [Aspergillus unguis]